MQEIYNFVLSVNLLSFNGN